MGGRSRAVEVPDYALSRRFDCVISARVMAVRAKLAHPTVREAIEVAAFHASALEQAFQAQLFLLRWSRSNGGDREGALAP